MSFYCTFPENSTNIEPSIWRLEGWWFELGLSIAECSFLKQDNFLHVVSLYPGINGSWQKLLVVTQ